MYGYLFYKATCHSIVLVDTLCNHVQFSTVMYYDHENLLCIVKCELSVYYCQMYHIVKHGIQKCTQCTCFFVSVNRYQRRVLAIRITEE
jgi:hypothetical protein